MQYVYITTSQKYFHGYNFRSNQIKIILLVLNYLLQNKKFCVKFWMGENPDWIPSASG